MKKIIIIITLLISVIKVNAQDGYKHFIFRGGLTYKEGFNYTVGIDFADKYYSSYEISINYFKRTKPVLYQNYMFGVFYKPLIFREKNTLMKFRFGALLGSDSVNFLVAPSLGFEYLKSLSNNVDFVITNNNGFYFFSNEKWMCSATAGFRVAF